MAEKIEVQTVDDVKVIDYRRINNQNIQNAIDTQISQTDMISETLTDIQNTISTQSDLSEVTELIENIDTTIVEVQTQDILNTVNDQQNQINDIQSSVDDINDKLNQILEKL